MRAQSVLMAALVAGAIVTPSAAQAQFSLDPRALLGRIAAPLRHILPHPQYRARTSNHGPARAAAAQPDTPEPDTGAVGSVGPHAWPAAYQDVIGYTFWPKDYDTEFRHHGFGDITTAILMPVVAAPGAEARRRSPETTGRASNVDASNAPTCDDQVAQDNWPKTRIEQTIQLTSVQRSALDRLQETVNSAAKSIRADACRDAVALPPAQRLEAMVHRLWAVQNAGIVIRAALRNFYDTLTDEQKATFQEARQANQPAGRNTINPMGREQACAQTADDGRLIRQIQQTVRPTSRQKQSVEMLGRSAAGMAQYLMASCAQPTPEDPMARLDAANASLTAINYAATSMEVALSQFQAALTDEQRKKFDALGR